MFTRKLYAAYAAVLATVSEAAVSSDPAKAGYPFSLLCVGDWGSAPNRASCCSRRSTFTNYDIGLEDKFSWQRDYVSPNDNRWSLKDHFYVKRIDDAVTGVSVDIFNVDTNDADVHGAQQICCQCYGYSNGDSATCRNVGRGHKFCCAGDTAMFDACMAKFAKWGADSRAQLAEQVKRSNATWKIVHTHYSAYTHFGPVGMNKWFDTLQGSGIHVWLNGHTHAAKHDYSASLRIHWMENGASGGIQNEGASGIPDYAASYIKKIWAYPGNEYGFMSLQASKEWLKLQYHTADSAWVFGEDLKTTKIGGVATKHCWYIPVDGTEGRAC
ncbi:hypothetical protein PsorP6_009838 [Peronosclerospora sorghi]|uniref:Uncharacterized protein n=1 Tax=Peronosclerospora sorghi TaxID=230839 RepID=A0ACC0W0E8_9STRA|nr:hypothetical protein PsorP6_009838 [Peronosclerospora sorghi]